MAHIADKEVTWRRVALAKKRWKKQKMRGGENYWKIVEKKEKKREGKREKG